MTEYLKTAERIVVTIAALLAIVPIYQYYSEADDRRIERAANVISALKACDDIDQRGAPSAVMVHLCRDAACLLRYTKTGQAYLQSLQQNLPTNRSEDDRRRLVDIYVSKDFDGCLNGE